MWERSISLKTAQWWMPLALVETGILRKSCDGVKILANGELKKKLTVKATAFSEAAKAKIEAAGGKAEVI